MSERGLEEDEGEKLVSSGDQSTEQKRGPLDGAVDRESNERLRSRRYDGNIA